MSNEIPKEQMSAYQRWELSSFDPPNAKNVLVPPTEEQIQNIKNAAYQEGLSLGLTEGRAQGLIEGRHLTEAESKKIQALCITFQNAVGEAEQGLATAILGLTLQLTKSFLHAALELKPELVIPMIQENIHALTATQMPIVIYLQPNDAAIVRNYLKDDLAQAGWRIKEDSTLLSGGFKIETPQNLIDASIETRWNKLASALVLKNDWLGG